MKKGFWANVVKVNPKALRSAITAGLPERARWMIEETPLDYDFSIGRMGLRQLTNDVLDGGPKKWRELLIFGRDDYAEGGGSSAFLGIRTTDGTVYRLDPERKTPLSLLNSSIQQFIDTFGLLDKYLGQGIPLPLDIRTQLRSIDRKAYPKSEWRLLVEHLTDA